MATPNFAHPRNASTYFVVGTEVRDHWEWDDIETNLRHNIEELQNSKDIDVMVYDYKLNDYNRSYPSKALGVIEASKSFGDVEVQLKVIPIVTSAYYEGATLDYLIEYSDNRDDYDEVDDFLDCAFDEYYSEMNKGMLSIQRSNAETWIENTLPDIIAELEKIFAMNSEHKLACKGVFSNGEAVYEHIK